MKKHNHSRTLSLHVVAGAAIAALALISGAAARADDLAETLEIRWSTPDAAALKAKADELQTPVRIFEFVRNEMEYAVYHGARSNSANTFLGRRGNDVDLASVLIAMLRSQGVPARYATGNVDMDAAAASNWVGVQDPEVAERILQNMGIQNVALSGGQTRLALDHVWVEALVPYDNYRGAGADLAHVNCATEPTKCRWVALDPSFKRVANNEAALDLYGLPEVAFDYREYYGRPEGWSVDPTNIVVVTAEGGWWDVTPADVDGDGDLDVVGSLVSGGGGVKLYENPGAPDATWTEQVMPGATPQTYAVSPADVDNDGDVDIMAAANSTPRVGWYENLDSTGTSWSQHTVEGIGGSAYDVVAADMDGDGDTDALFSTTGTVSWSENIDGKGQSWETHTIGDSGGSISPVFAIDLDDDGDLDAVSGWAYDAKIEWHENLDSSGDSWATHEISASEDGARSVFAVDVDGDGDADVLSAATDSGRVAWHENLDSRGGSWATHEIAMRNSLWDVSARDMDGDGDTDVLVAASVGQAAWYENSDSAGTSWLKHAMEGVVGGGHAVVAADVDDDGDEDVLMGAYGGGGAIWYLTKGSPSKPSPENPLEVYEDQILSYLWPQYPGKTLSDVAYAGQIVPEQLNVLPASLPYRLVAAPVTFDSVALHDAAKSPNWENMLSLEAVAPEAAAGGSDLVIVGPVAFPLAQLSTESLVLGFADCGADCVEAQLRLDGALVGTPPQFSELAFYDEFVMHLTLDTTPEDPGEEGEDGVRCEDEGGGVTECWNVAEATYGDLQVGGLFLAATGGETSSWAQVHDASDKLLEAHGDYPIVLDPAGIPYVDEDASGDYSPADTRLLDHPEANAALTGGLLYTTGRLYYAQFHDMVQRLDALNHVKTPILALMGVVSSRYDVDFLDGTAFEVHPGGLVLDLKGTQAGGVHRVDDVDVFVNDHIELLGHAASALEHEVWQQLTGFDAVSTVRGIQFALADGADLIDIRSDDQSLAEAAPLLGLGLGAPTSPWVYRDAFDIYGARVWGFRPSGSAQQVFHSWRLIDPDADGNYTFYGFANYDSTYLYYGFDWYGLAQAEGDRYQYIVDEFTADPDGTPTLGTCDPSDGSPIDPGDLPGHEIFTWADFIVFDEACFLTLIQGYYPYADYFPYWDENDLAGTGLPYVPGEQSFLMLPSEEFPGNPRYWVGMLRAEFLARTQAAFKGATDLNLVEAMVFPSTLVESTGEPFQVYIEKIYDLPDPVTGERLLGKIHFRIQNESWAAGGSWVSGLESDWLVPHLDFEGELFDSYWFNDYDLMLRTNNDWLCGANTGDPVSTITGNMFHDETDFVIPGRSIDLAFTRTYNSGSNDSASAPLGPGWTHSYNMHLVANDYGDVPHADASVVPANENEKTSSITYVNERGGAVNFLVDDLDASPSWAVTSPAGSFDVLTLDDPAPGQATLSFVNGVKYIFEGPDLRTPGAHAWLAEITSPEGDSLTLEYEDGQLKRVTEGPEAEAAGRTGLVFAYDGAYLESVTDWEGRSWTFGYTGTGGAVGFPVTQDIDTSANGVRSLATADLDGDGRLDVIAAAENDHEVLWYENPGDGSSWTVHTLTTQTYWPTCVVPADIDGDLDMDVAVASRVGGQVLWYRNDGTGGGWAGSLIEGGAPGVTIAVGPINDDASLDMVAGIPGSRRIRWFEQLSPTNWDPHTIDSSLDEAEWIAIGDFDNDGDSDVVSAADPSGRLVWNWNSSSGASWSSDSFFASSNSVEALAAGDVDGDGIDDVVAAFNFSDLIAWYRYESGSWTEHIIDTSLDDADSLFVADLDGDGDGDVLAASRDVDTVSWFQNDGGEWTPHPITTSASGARAVHAADLDGDGDLDVIYGADASGVVGIALNTLANVGRLETVTNPLAETTSYGYADESGLLELIRRPQDRDGAQVETRFSYYRNGRAFDNANSYGHGEVLDYDLFRKKTRVTGFRDEVQEFSYDRSGRLVKLREPDGAVLRFGHTHDHLRNSKTDGLGYETQYSYCLDPDAGCGASDSMGLVTLERDPKEFTVEMDYEGPHNRISRIQDKNGAERVFTYYDHTDGATGAFDGKLETAQIKQLGAHSDVVLERFFYYDNGNLKTQVEYLDPTDPAKTRTTTYIYNDSGLNPAKIVPEEITVVGWDGETSRRTREIDALGQVTSETLYRRTSYSNATEIQLTTQYEYDDLGRVTLITDPDLNQEKRLYDDNGQLTKVQRRFWLEASSEYTPWDSVVRRKYDLADRMIEERDINDGLTAYEYDEAGNVIQVTGPTGQTLRYEYDPMNRRTAVIDENGHRLETVYDLAGRPVKVIDPTGIAVETEYDENGRLVKVEDPQLGNQTQLDYDREGHLTKTINANASADATLLNSHGASEYREYDELGRVVLIVDALDKETSFTYDLLGNGTSITDAENNTTTFEYDGLGRLEVVEEPGVGGLATTHEYDEAGNRIYTQYRSGAEEVVDYDNLNRPTTSTILGTGDVQSWAYDDRERLETIGNAEVSYGLTYDLKNRLETRTDSRLPSQPVDYDYDAADRLTRKTDYQGDVTEFDYDGTGRLVGERNAEYLQVSYQYDGAGRALRRILSNGARTEYAYDAGGRLAKLSNRTADGTLLQEIEYTQRDRVGNVEQLTTTHADGRVEVADFQYDPLHRLEEAVYTVDSIEAERQSFTYDAVGNRKTKTSTLAGGQTHHYFYNDTNQLTDIRLGPAPTDALVHHFEYDDNGNMASRSDAGGSPELVLHYDERDRVSSIDVSGAEVARYKYDPLGYRIENDGSAGIRRSLLDAEHLEAVYDDQDNVRAKFLRGTVIDEVVNAYYYDAQGKESTYTYHHDALQSVVGLSGHAGTVEETLRYGPFGELLEQGGSSPSALRFTGREFDAETGLYYYRARYYDPEVGRFLSEDPLGFDAGINFYTYVGSNPINANDPSGNAVETPWDVFNVGLGTGSLTYNVAKGNWGWAAVDALGLAYDVGATAVPFLPAGASAALKVWRGGSGAYDAVRVGRDVARVADLSNDFARAADMTGNAATVGTQIHRNVGNALDAGNLLSDPANNFFRGSNRASGIQPDLSWDSAAGVWADLTTPGQWQRHVNRYEGTFGEGIPLLYERGTGLVGTTRLYSGAGTFLTGAQLLSSGASSGFAPYASDTNTNMMQSVCGK